MMLTDDLALVPAYVFNKCGLFFFSCSKLFKRQFKRKSACRDFVFLQLGLVVSLKFVQTFTLL